MFDLRYRQTLVKEQNDVGALDGLATALLGFGSINEALGCFERARALDQSESRGSPAFLAEIATCQWLLGMRDRSKSNFLFVVNGILNRSIILGDLAGGVSQGLQRWYVSVSGRDLKNSKYALSYLNGLTARPRIKYFPGIIARYVLGLCDFPSVLKEAVGNEDLRAGIEIAKNDILKRRHLCQALFYRAVVARDRGSEGESLEYMRLCCSLENPINEVEWYLARGECKRIITQ